MHWGEDLDAYLYLPTKFILHDHINGFDQQLNCQVLQLLDNAAKKLGRHYSITYHQLLPDTVKQYTNLTFSFDPELHDMYNLSLHLGSKDVVPSNQCKFDNFVCSLNGFPHLSRQLLVSALNKFQWFDEKYSTKNFELRYDYVADLLKQYLSDDEQQLYLDSLLGNTESSSFYSTIVNFYFYQRNEGSANLANNLRLLSRRMQPSFINIVAETHGTSYWPFVTEKFLEPIVTKNLFLTYSQPGHNQQIKDLYGFKPYSLFDYSFDREPNPVKRLYQLLNMLKKYESLSLLDWHDLYMLEKDTVDYNYDHYFSRDYYKVLEKTTVDTLHTTLYTTN